MFQVVERQKMTIQYAGDTPPDQQQLVAAAQGQAVEGVSVTVSEETAAGMALLMHWCI